MTTAQQPRWLDAREQSVWRSFLDMQARLGAHLNRELVERSGISNPDFSVLVVLSEHDGGTVRALELARALRWEKSRLSHQLSRMEQRGLVIRTNCTEDRRGSWVALTPRGRTTIESAAPTHVETVRSVIFDRLDAGQLAALAGICAAITDALDDAARGTDCAGDGPIDTGGPCLEV